jgi:ABC-type molybdate transport system substrate-binding protein
VRIPRSGARNTQYPTRDSVVIRGAPILYALAIPREAANVTGARAFVEWLLGPEGRAVLVRNGFTVLESPIIHGAMPPWLRALTH